MVPQTLQAMQRKSLSKHLIQQLNQQKRREEKWREVRIIYSQIDRDHQKKKRYTVKILPT